MRVGEGFGEGDVGEGFHPEGVPEGRSAVGSFLDGAEGGGEEGEAGEDGVELCGWEWG